MDPKGLQGAVHKSVTLTTNDPVRPQLSVTIEAEVVADVNTDPRNLDFGNVEVDKGGSHVVTAWLRDGLPGKIVAAKSGTRGIAAELLDAPGRKVRIRVATTSDVTPGMIRGSVRVVTDAPDAPTGFIYLRGEVLGNLTFDPKWLNLAPTRSGVVSVRRRDGKPAVHVTGAASTHAGVTATVVEVTPGVAYEVRATVAADVARAQGTLTLRTDDPRQPTIPLRFFYNPPATN